MVQRRKLRYATLRRNATLRRIVTLRRNVTLRLSKGGSMKTPPITHHTYSIIYDNITPTGFQATVGDHAFSTEISPLTGLQSFAKNEGKL